MQLFSLAWDWLAAGSLDEISTGQLRRGSWLPLALLCCAQQAPWLWDLSLHQEQGIWLSPRVPGLKAIVLGPIIG